VNLNFNEDLRIWIRKGYVTKTLENPPYFISLWNSSDPYSCETTLESTRFCSRTN